VIVGAALLVLLGLGLFVAGILTGVTTLYWACVAACAIAAVLLIAARRQLGTVPRPAAASTETPTVERGPADGPGEVAGTALSDDGSAVRGAAAPDERPDPPVEEVEVTDLLLVVDLTDEVLVVDEHPRYHLAGCVHLTGRETIPVPLDEARTDGFTPCAACSPDRTLAERVRARRHAADG
jgi:hypothetical protein